ncbi:MAG TPA: SIS domain-containing protein [Steroidobacteraceae bacterium]|nr:SIS domain-containing protein [Steroidobacteraceae bacterium]
MNAGTRMFREAAAAPEAVRSQLLANRGAVDELAKVLRQNPPRAVVTCARGSSDHAATYARYLIETRTGLLTSSASPSVSSLYAARTDLDSALFLSISQSGASPDLLTAAQAAKEAGALVVALLNTEDSPLARIAHHVLPLRAGAESSVAATKSFIASLAAIVHLVASWMQDDALQGALASLPEQLVRAWQLDWSAAIEPLRTAGSLFVVGRGLGLGIAQEAALKFKETCGLHAEAFSSAELRHGPIALAGRGFPVLAFAQQDEARGDVEALAAELAGLGAQVLLAGSAVSGTLELPALRAHPALEPLLLIQSFYRLVDSLAAARGRDPDRPPNLRKVTETV